MLHKFQIITRNTNVCILNTKKILSLIIVTFKDKRQRHVRVGCELMVERIVSAF